MSKFTDKVLNIVGIVIAVAALVFLVVYGIRLYNEFQVLQNQVEKNSKKIDEQKLPCTTEDVRFPEKIPGCTGE